MRPDTGKGLLSRQQRDIDGLKRGFGAPNPFARISALQGRNAALNGNFRTNQMGYVSGDPMLEKWCFDRWYGSGRMNLVKNPVAAVNTTGWTANAHTVSRLTGQVIADLAATTAVRMTAVAADANGVIMLSTTAPYLFVTPGETITVSAYVRASVIKTVFIGIVWKNGNDATVGANSVSGNTVLVANTWTRISLTVVVPAGVNHISLYSYPTANWVIGETYDISGVMLEKSAALGAYIDPMSVSFVSAPQGQQITVPAGYPIATNIERADVPAGPRTLSWEGSILGRVYKAGGVVGPYTTGPIVWEGDGTDDVRLEFLSTDGPGTLGNVQFEAGRSASAYEEIPLVVELLRCFRYYMKWKPNVVNQRIAGIGILVATTTDEFMLFTPVQMKGSPAINFMLLYSTDGVSASAAITAMSYYFASIPASSPTVLSLAVTHGAYGAIARPTAFSAQNTTTSFLELRSDF